MDVFSSLVEKAHEQLHLQPTLSHHGASLSQGISSLVRINESFLWALFAITFNPLWWNIVARLEYKTHFITKIVRSPYVGCYLLMVAIFALNIWRDLQFANAMQQQPHLVELGGLANSIIYHALFVGGLTLVLTSFWKLGITGTYLGDYFGILMKERVTSFPFNLMEHPMYNGATMLFFSFALRDQSPAGILLACYAFIVYQIAAVFEGDFTTQIYANANKNTQRRGKNSRSKRKRKAQ